MSLASELVRHCAVARPFLQEKFDDGYYGVAEDVKPEIPDDLISDDEGSGGIGYDDDESGECGDSGEYDVRW